MSPRPKIEDVAALAGVSIATVSRVLSRPELVKAETRERVQAAVRSLDYMPSASAQALASGRTHSVGYVVPTLDHAIFSRSTHAMQKELAHAGIQLLVASHEYDLKSELDIVSRLQQRRVDALVLVGTDHNPALWGKLKAWGRPVLLTWSCDPRFPSIGFDNYQVGFQAGQYLMSLGHRRLGMVSGVTQHNDRARARVAGFRDALAQKGVTLPPAWLSEQSFTLQAGADGLRQVMRGKRRPTAIFCGNDLLATGAMFEAQRMGLSVPHDVSIMGVDNQEIAQAIVPTLTTIELAMQDMGVLSAQQTIHAIHGRPVPSQSLLAHALIERESTAPVAG
jgi:LacI family transcriptional regulator